MLKNECFQKKREYLLDLGIGKDFIDSSQKSLIRVNLMKINISSCGILVSV